MANKPVIIDLKEPNLVKNGTDVEVEATSTKKYGKNVEVKATSTEKYGKKVNFINLENPKAI